MEKTRVTFLLPQALADEIRDAVISLAGHPYRLTMAKFAEHACEAYLKQLKKEANQNKPFPKSTSKLKGGRPVGS